MSGKGGCPGEKAIAGGGGSRNAGEGAQTIY